MPTEGIAVAADRSAPPGADTEREISAFLFHEAELLDDRRFEEWLALFAEDATYEVPIRVTRERQAEWELAPNAWIFNDTKETLAIRIQRLATEYAWAEQPASRTRHFVANVRVTTVASGDHEVRSNLLVYRSRGSSIRVDLFSADRRDTLRRTAQGWLIARRWVALDQSTVDANNISIFF
ncbi:MAG: aromatic-ring-hydroxylating dioxygenase subunit beta [Acidimicrobiales bacterium]